MSISAEKSGKKVGARWANNSSDFSARRKNSCHLFKIAKIDSASIGIQAHVDSNCGFVYPDFCDLGMLLRANV